MGEHLSAGLPADLESVLRDQSVVTCKDAALSELIATCVKSPTTTASAALAVGPDQGLVEALYRQTNAARSTTVGC